MFPQDNRQLSNTNITLIPARVETYLEKKKRKKYPPLYKLCITLAISISSKL